MFFGLCDESSAAIQACACRYHVLDKVTHDDLHDLCACRALGVLVTYHVYADDGLFVTDLLQLVLGLCDSPDLNVRSRASWALGLQIIHTDMLYDYANDVCSKHSGCTGG